VIVYLARIISLIGGDNQELTLFVLRAQFGKMNDYCRAVLRQFEPTFVFLKKTIEAIL